MTQRKKDEVQVLTEKLRDALIGRYEASSTIQHTGKQFIVPEYMPYEEAIKVLKKHIDEMESEVSKSEELVGHPHDCLNAVYEGIKGVFGDLVGKAGMIDMLFFSQSIPERQIDIQIGFDEFKTVPYGELEVPGLPVEMSVSIEQNDDNIMQSSCWLNFEYKKLYTPLVSDVIKAVRAQLKNNSIFKGKAIDSQFTFINLDQSPLERIVYAEHEELQLQAELFNILRMRDELKKAHRPVKRTILLEGNYGTGKTLTALKAAVESVENGWTFIQVRPKDSISASIEFAKKYQPCVVFFEDVDQVTHGQRDQDMNEVLNTIDGMLNKDTEVVIVLTTNRVRRIEKAMLRPGRIDTLIEMGHIDEQAILGHIRVQLGDQLEGDLDTDALVKAAEGYTPAFVVEALNKAVLYTFARTGDLKAPVLGDDVVASLKNLRPQFEIMMGEQETDELPVGEMFVRDIVEKVDGRIGALKEQLDPRVLKGS